MSEIRDRKDALLEAGLALASELSLPMVLQRIVDLAAEVTDARYAALGVIGPGGDLVDFITTGISARQRRAIGALPHGRGLLGLLIREPRIVRVPEILKHPGSVGFPTNHPPMTSFLGAPVQAIGRVYGNIYLTDKRSASEFSEDDERSLLILATQAGVAIANASLYQESLQRERWLDALRQISDQILEGVDPGSLLTSIAEHARELAGADAASILTTTASPGRLEVTAAVGAYALEVRNQSVPAKTSISGKVIETGKVLHTNDASTHARAYQPIIRLGHVGPAIFVPLRVRGRATGTLMVANLKGGRAFDEITIRLVETFADQASVAIEYSRAQEDVKRVELMEERERIARELHDGIIQSLFAVGMGLQGAALLAGSPETAGRIDGAVDELDRVIRDLRNYIFGLRPGILADRQLDQALRELADDLQKRSGSRVEIEVDAALAASLSSRSHQIVQLTREALSNVARHAAAGQSAVRLAREGKDAVLTIEDDGFGFDVSAGSEGNGLRNMRERAEAMGGAMLVKSAQGRDQAANNDPAMSSGDATIAGVPKGRLRIMLVDDHEVVRDGVKSLINAHDDLTVVAEAASVQEAIDQAVKNKPDVVVMDVRLADGSGIEATREIRARLDGTQVLMLTSFADDEALFASIMAGAAGYVLKQIRGGELIRAIREVGAGRSLLDPEVTRSVLERLRKGKTMRDEKLARLSAQEERILTLIARGLTNGQIGKELKLAEKTVKNYVSTILSKLEVARRAEAAAYLARHTTTPGSQ